MHYPKVSVIIPTFRDTEGLRATLDALSRQTYPATRIEILCIDNTPDFELGDQLASLAPARLLHEPRPGSYAARNRGLAEATGEVFAFTDADCLPDSDWLEAGVAELARHPRGALIAGNIKSFSEDPENPTPVEALEIRSAFPQERYATLHHFGATANVFVTRSVVDQAGPFLSGLISGGDKEFGSRVYASGFPVIYCQAATVRHPARRELGALLAKTRRVVAGVYDLEMRGRVPKGSFLRGFFGDLRPPVKTCWNIISTPASEGLYKRFQVAGVVILVRYYRAIYRLRVLARRNAS